MGWHTTAVIAFLAMLAVGFLVYSIMGGILMKSVGTLSITEMNKTGRPRKEESSDTLFLRAQESLRTVIEHLSSLTPATMRLSILANILQEAEAAEKFLERATEQTFQEKH